MHSEKRPIPSFSGTWLYKPDSHRPSPPLLQHSSSWCACPSPSACSAPCAASGAATARRWQAVLNRWQPCHTCKRLWLPLHGPLSSPSQPDGTCHAGYFGAHPPGWLGTPGGPHSADQAIFWELRPGSHPCSCQQAHTLAIFGHEREPDIHNFNSQPTAPDAPPLPAHPCSQQLSADPGAICGTQPQSFGGA